MSLRRAHLHQRDPAGELLRGLCQSEDARGRKHHRVADRDQHSVFYNTVVDANAAPACTFDLGRGCKYVRHVDRAEHFHLHSPAFLGRKPARRAGGQQNTNAPRAKLKCDATVKLLRRSDTGTALTLMSRTSRTSAAMIPPRTWPRRGRAKMAAPGPKIQRGRA